MRYGISHSVPARISDCHLQETKCKSTQQSQFVTPAHAKSSYHWEWEIEGDKVCENVCGGIGNIVVVQIDFPRNVFIDIPTTGYRPNAHQVGEEEGDSP